MFIQHKGVPRGQHRTRQGRDHNRIVNIADDAAPGVIRHDENIGLGFDTVAADQFDLVPTGFQLGSDHAVDDAAAVCFHLELVTVDDHRDKCVWCCG